MSTNERTSAREIRLADYQAPDYLIDTIDLTFNLDPIATRVSATMHVRRNGSHSRPLILNGESLKLISIDYDGEKLSEHKFALTDRLLTLPDVREDFVLTIVTEINPAANTALEGLYQSAGNFCTQCEPEGFRRITYFVDRPDILARYSVAIIADELDYPVLLANGNPVSLESAGEGRQIARWVDPHPKPSYLFALVAGKLTALKDTFITQSGRKIDLAIYVEPHNADRCAHAMDSLKKSMRWDEETYGREYDLDVFNIVAVDDFNMGAMENKGLNIFNSRYILAKPDTATDADYAGIESVVAHEYFHNWSGNRVTCRDWFQLSLKEGFTVFRDQEFSADMGSRAVNRIQDVNMLRQIQFAEDAGPQAHPVQPKSYREINNFYTSTVYNKGAEVVRMQRNLLGWETFRRGTDLYFDRFDGQAVTIEDFLQCMSEASGKDLSQFRRWYDVAGTPKLRVSDARLPGQYILKIQQEISGSEPYMMPLDVALFTAEGDPIALDGTGVLVQTLTVCEMHQSWSFSVDVPPNIRIIPSLNRGFTAPVEIHYPYDQEALAILSHADSDPFNRWDAMQKLWLLTLLERIKSGQNGPSESEPPLPEGLSHAFGQILLESDQDPMFVAECISLPSEKYLADQFDENIPFEAIHRERNLLRRQLAEVWESTLLLVYEKNQPADHYRYEPRAVGQRQVRRLVLSYLTTLDRPAWLQLAVTQFDRADNMTESFNALFALSVRPTDVFERLMARFEERWRHDPLIMDKWFALQAQRTDGDALERVRQLMGHPAFSLKNPNRVHALIGSYARGNLMDFHAPDGHGYQWLADRIIEIDGFNPQLAARLATAFNIWKRLDPARAILMKEALVRMNERPACSPDLSEITGKSLGY
ncbi:aminopeptidase N [Halothiobacillus diazotrophicus]|uniref:Aminopeptidase N n=1 Tax=Halothiobacillus diazotrophicus TaxID=1860122 RepID=A0A191ZEZ3_9GAMM|nr:aminopeptidase N [Halothiobacillus diazotrophicus]ANJ66432.1 aminopeptidase N [Halothiobacillus diazotrophicus]